MLRRGRIQSIRLAGRRAVHHHSGRQLELTQTIRLAVIDNDSGFVTVLAKRTEAAGWQLRHVASSIPPEELVAMKLNALLLDPAVLGDEGWDYLERVCGMLPDLGVVVCTGRSTVAQRVRGLRLGVDDWITKPCHPEEAMARVEAVSRRRRRGRPEAEAGPLVAGELEIRADQFQAFVSGDSLDLTRREFELLQLLAEAKGQVLERETIYQRVWGYAMAHGDRSVDVFIRKLRQKLEKRSPGWSYIHTHFGVGYRFDPEPHARRRSPEPEQAPDRRAPVLHRPFTTASPLCNRRRRLGHARRPWRRERTRSSAAGGRLEIRPEEHAALVDGRPLSLTMRELQLLVTLSSHPQRIMTREELYAEVWGGEPRHDDRSVDVYVSRLRSKLGEALPEMRLIHTHNGIGYRFSPDG